MPPSLIRGPETGDAGCFPHPYLEKALRVTTNHQNDKDRRAGVMRCQETVEKEKTRHKACEANDYSRPYTREQPMKNMEMIDVPPSKG